MTGSAVLERPGGEEAAADPSAPDRPVRRRGILGPAEVLRPAVDRLRGASPASWCTAAVVVLSVVFVLLSVQPALIFRENTPTGGDMGAHVWGPMYLLRHVLPHGRLSGWSPDWYAGFPAYQFYMVVPMLAVVALHVGLRSALVVPALGLAGAVAASGWFVVALRPWRRALLGAGIVLAVLATPVPYGVAFKLVTVSGLLALPVAAWAFGRLAGAPFPGPALLAVASLFVIYNREPNLNGGTGNIIGGNLASTMAGEFAFSISLALTLLYLGFLVNGLRTGRHRTAAAVLLALAGLSHLIPVFFALAMTAVALVVWPGRARLRWLTPVLVVAGLLASFWVLPFLWRGAYVNDMGWEKLPQKGTTGPRGPQTIWDYLFPRSLLWPVIGAGLGAVVSLIFRFRAGLFLAAGAVLSALGFVFVPQARLWNARVLPFYYVSLFLLAGVGVALVLHALAVLFARDPLRPGAAMGIGGAVAAFVAAALFLGIPLGTLPGATLPVTGGAELRIGGLTLHRTYRNDVPSWVKWNFSGLEGKLPANGPGQKAPEGQGGWPEYRAIVATMQRLGNDPRFGCGRAFWEYGSRLETYGTPMALMLLPYFTDSCIGSMEGLYFESSATTPYHFLAQCELSQTGSCAQRDLAYRSFDLDLGIRQLQLLGVKYYMAFSDQAVRAADADRRLTRVAASGPWRVYRIRDSALVAPLTAKPAVMRNIGDQQSSWLDPSAAWFLQPQRWSVPLATDGPADWPRVTVPPVPSLRKGTNCAAPSEPRTPCKRKLGDRSLPAVREQRLPKVTVSDIRSGDDSVSFRVDRIGVPVLVKVSYFPNWQASGARGPWRVTPNLMVVIPTSRDVRLSYGRTGVDWLAIILTLLGIAAAVWLARRPPVTMPSPRWAGVGDGEGPFPWLADRGERGADDPLGVPGPGLDDGAPGDQRSGGAPGDGEGPPDGAGGSDPVDGPPPPQSPEPPPWLSPPPVSEPPPSPAPWPSPPPVVDEPSPWPSRPLPPAAVPEPPVVDEPSPWPARRRDPGD
ncbi:MAG: hypothetical protein HYX34_05835 [Actinobacteria bacterium]|nr:hypothetical protein [Actinomycetota bacterium]